MSAKDTANTPGDNEDHTPAFSFVSLLANETPDSDQMLGSTKFTTPDVLNDTDGADEGLSSSALSTRFLSFEPLLAAWNAWMDFDNCDLKS